MAEYRWAKHVDRQRRLAYDQIDKEFPRVSALIDAINNGLSLEYSYTNIYDLVGQYVSEARLDLKRFGDPDQQKLAGQAKKPPEANLTVNRLVGQLIQEIHSYFEYRRQSVAEDTEPGDLEVIKKLRNYVEHQAGGTYLPLHYVFVDRKSPKNWGLILDLTLITRDMLPMSKRKGKGALEALINLTQNKNGIIYVSEHIEALVADIATLHDEISGGISGDLEKGMPILHDTLDEINSYGDEEQHVSDILEMYILRNEERLSIIRERRA